MKPPKSPAVLSLLLLAAALCGAAALPAPLCPGAERPTGALAAAAGPPWPALDYDSIDTLDAPADYEDLIQLSAVSAVSRLCAGSLSAVAYATALLKRARATQCLNAWAALSPGAVLAEAAAADAAAASGRPARPLCGLPVGLKDVLDADGYPTVAGTPALEGHYPPMQSLLTARLKAAGGVVLGKLRMHELGGGDTTVSPVYGPTLNPHNVTHTVGGSSGGGGAALAARAAPLVLCADSGGSCRSPAALTGTVGYRPSTGCFDAGAGVVGMGPTRDTVGVGARSVADARLLSAVLSDCSAPGAADQVASLSGLRVGRPAFWWDDIGDEVRLVLDAAMEALKAAGAVVVDVDAAPLMAFYFEQIDDGLFYSYEMPRELAMYLATHNYSTSMQELVASIGTTSTRLWLSAFLHGGWPTAAQYQAAVATSVPELRRRWQALFDDADVAVLALPTTPLPARPIADVEPMIDLNGMRKPFYEVMGRAFMADCVGGVPSISLPAGVTASFGPYPGGLPVGLMLQARRTLF